MTEHKQPTPIGSDQAPLELRHLKEIENAIRGPSVQRVLDVRLSQIVEHGHDAEHDAMLPIGYLPRKAHERILAAIEVLDGREDGERLARAQRALSVGLAIGLAALDRIGTAIEAGEAKKQKQGELL